MALPSLNNWHTTRIGLHQASQVVSSLRRVVAEPEPNWTHIGLRYKPGGLTTEELPNLGKVDMNFADRSLVVTLSGIKPEEISFQGLSPTQLADALEEKLREHGHKIVLDRGKIVSTEPLDVDVDLACDYDVTLGAIIEALGQFRASLPGEKSPLVVWAHGFDAGFLWFATDQLIEEAPHLNFGFSPGSPGFDRPYAYAYPWPRPENMTHIPLCAPAYWYTETWQGLVLEYDQFRSEQYPAQVIQNVFTGMYESFAPLLK